MAIFLVFVTVEWAERKSIQCKVGSEMVKERKMIRRQILRRLEVDRKWMKTMKNGF